MHDETAERMLDDVLGVVNKKWTRSIKMDQHCRQHKTFPIELADEDVRLEILSNK